MCRGLAKHNFSIMRGYLTMLAEAKEAQNSLTTQLTTGVLGKMTL